jgi:tetrachlorobenzoquinone reductase
MVAAGADWQQRCESSSPGRRADCLEFFDLRLRFTVVLQRSGKQVLVQAGQTILEALQDVGIEVSYSCMEGICGSCETRVISGTPDHRDMVLSERDRRTKNTMMVCCSGAKSDRLVLDL